MVEARLGLEGRSGGFISRSPPVAFRSELAAKPCLSDKALGKTMDKLDLQSWPTNVHRPQPGRSASTGRTRVQPRKGNGTRPGLSQMHQRAHAGNGREVEHVFS